MSEPKGTVTAGLGSEGASPRAEARAAACAD